MNAQVGAARSPRALLTARGALLVVLLGGLLVSATYPARQLLGQRGRIEALQHEGRQIRERVAGARADIASLATDEEVERIARGQLGMVRPGEVAFAIASGSSGKGRAGAAASRAAGASKRPAPQRAEASGFSRWWEAFVRAFGRAL